MKTSCDECRRRLATVCGECVASRLADGEAASGRAEVVDLATRRAIRLLLESGLVAPRAQRRAG